MAVENLNETLRPLTKRQIQWLAKERCRHGKEYLTHYSCFKEEREGIPPERIGFFDIEAGSLNADFGVLLSYSFADQEGKVIGASITTAELRNERVIDKRLVKKCLADMERFERIVTFYGARYDIPFLRARALYHKLDFPQRGSLRHTDIFFWARRSMKLHRNRLQTHCDHLSIPSKGHKLDGRRWIAAMAGNQKALNYILVHNREDVLSTKALYDALLPYNQLTNTSI